MNCCICNKKIERYGHNPYPIKNKGNCCDVCNTTLVIPKRLKFVIKTELKLNENNN